MLDQDEALDFYVGKLGLEVNIDQDLGFMRWLTVCVPGEPGREILLEMPGPPAMDEATAEQVRELVTKGAIGRLDRASPPTTPHKTYDELVAEGVEFTEEPTERPYGIDCGIARPVRQRDPHRAAQMITTSDLTRDAGLTVAFAMAVVLGWTWVSVIAARLMVEGVSPRGSAPRSGLAARPPPASRFRRRSWRVSGRAGGHRFA